MAKLSAAGALSYSTYLGGSAIDEGLAIAVDSGGSAYVTGATKSTSALPTEGFPTKNPLQAAHGGNTDAFVTKLNFSGSPVADLVYSTYLGGSGDDPGQGIAVDSSGNAYVTGYTVSTNFPTASPLQPAHRGGYTDAFVSKLNVSGSALSYSTYLGGSDSDGGNAIAVDAGANAYVVGGTLSANFPTVSAVQATYATGGDAFVSKLNAGGSALLSSTYLGGSQGDAGNGIAVDSAGSAYVTGNTGSTNFPTSSPAQGAKNAQGDAFVSKLTGSGAALSTLAYSTYLGGSLADQATGIAVDSAGSAYVTGSTYSTSFPTASPLRAANGGGQDAFVSKLVPGADLSISKTAAPDPVLAGQPLTYTLNVENAGPDVARAVSVSDQLPSGVTLVAASSGCSQAQAAGVVTVTCSVGDLAKGEGAQREITVRPTAPNPTLSNTARVTSQTPDLVSANDSATATTDVREPAPGSADVSLTKTDSPDPVANGGQLTYTLTAHNAGPDDAHALILRDELPAGVLLVSAPPDCSQPPATLVVCNVASLANKDSVAREIVVRPTAPNPSLTNIATVQSSTADPLSSNNTAVATTTVQAVADVSVTKRDFPDPVVAGEQLTYTLRAGNAGPDVAPAVSLHDQLPAGVQVVSASGCSVSDGAVSCNVGDLASGGAAAVERKIVVRPTEANPALSNTASVQTSAVDQNAANDSATATTEVREAPPPPPGGGTTDPPAGGGPPAGGALIGASPFPPATPPPPGAPPPAAALVAVSDHSITPRRFSAAPSGPSALAAARKRTRKPKASGAKVSYRLTMAASVRFTVSQTRPGRRQGKAKSARCVAQTKRNRKAAKCKRIVVLKGSFILAGKTGANSFRFTGRLANRKLRPGSYTLTATPTANARTGKPASLTFTITR